MEAWQPHWSNDIPSAYAAVVVYEVVWPYWGPPYAENTSAPLKRTPTLPPCDDRSLDPVVDVKAAVVMDGSKGTLNVVGVPYGVFGFKTLYGWLGQPFITIVRVVEETVSE